MARPVLLNNLDHREIRVVRDHGALFGDSVNQVELFPTEFEQAQREYPIIFRQDADGCYRAMALLGLDRDENLFLDAVDWHARYVPALLQRGPFSIGLPSQDDGEPMIHIDLDHPRVSHTEGARVFRAHGGNSAYLDHIADVLRTIYMGHEVRGPMFATFEELDLIEPVAIEIELGECKRYTLPDCFTIRESRLQAMRGPELERLHHAGFLQPAIWAASSLGNIPRLIDMKNRRADRSCAGGTPSRDHLSAGAARLPIG